MSTTTQKAQSKPPYVCTSNYEKDLVIPDGEQKLSVLLAVAYKHMQGARLLRRKEASDAHETTDTSCKVYTQGMDSTSEADAAACTHEEERPSSRHLSTSFVTEDFGGKNKLGLVPQTSAYPATSWKSFENIRESHEWGPPGGLRSPYNVTKAQGQVTSGTPKVLNYKEQSMMPLTMRSLLREKGSLLREALGPERHSGEIQYQAAIERLQADAVLNDQLRDANTPSPCTNKPLVDEPTLATELPSAAEELPDPYLRDHEGLLEASVEWNLPAAESIQTGDFSRLEAQPQIQNTRQDSTGHSAAWKTGSPLEQPPLLQFHIRPSQCGVTRGLDAEGGEAVEDPSSGHGAVSEASVEHPLKFYSTQLPQFSPYASETVWQQASTGYVSASPAGTGTHNVQYSAPFVSPWFQIPRPHRQFTKGLLELPLPAVPPQSQLWGTALWDRPQLGAPRPWIQRENEMPAPYVLPGRPLHPFVREAPTLQPRLVRRLSSSAAFRAPNGHSGSSAESLQSVRRLNTTGYHQTFRRLTGWADPVGPTPGELQQQAILLMHQRQQQHASLQQLRPTQLQPITPREPKYDSSGWLPRDSTLRESLGTAGETGYVDTTYSTMQHKVAGCSTTVSRRNTSDCSRPFRCISAPRRDKPLSSLVTLEMSDTRVDADCCEGPLHSLHQVPTTFTIGPDPPQVHSQDSYTETKSHELRLASSMPEFSPEVSVETCSASNDAAFHPGVSEPLPPESPAAIGGRILRHLQTLRGLLTGDALTGEALSSDCFAATDVLDKELLNGEDGGPQTDSLAKEESSPTRQQVFQACSYTPLKSPEVPRSPEDNSCPSHELSKEPLSRGPQVGTVLEGPANPQGDTAPRAPLAPLGGSLGPQTGGLSLIAAGVPRLTLAALNGPSGTGGLLTSCFPPRRVPSSVFEVPKRPASPEPCHPWEERPLRGPQSRRTSCHINGDASQTVSEEQEGTQGTQSFSSVQTGGSSKTSVETGTNPDQIHHPEGIAASGRGPCCPFSASTHVSGNEDSSGKKQGSNSKGGTQATDREQVLRIASHHKEIMGCSSKCASEDPSESVLSLGGNEVKPDGFPQSTSPLSVEISFLEKPDTTSGTVHDEPLSHTCGGTNEAFTTCGGTARNLQRLNVCWAVWSKLSEGSINEKDAQGRSIFTNEDETSCSPTMSTRAASLPQGAPTEKVSFVVPLETIANRAFTFPTEDVAWEGCKRCHIEILLPSYQVQENHPKRHKGVGVFCAPGLCLLLLWEGPNVTHRAAAPHTEMAVWLLSELRAQQSPQRAIKAALERVLKTFSASDRRGVSVGLALVLGDETNAEYPLQQDSTLSASRPLRGPYKVFLKAKGTARVLLSSRGQAGRTFFVTDECIDGTDILDDVEFMEIEAGTPASLRVGSGAFWTAQGEEAKARIPSGDGSNQIQTLAEAFAGSTQGAEVVAITMQL
ncbi:hypothetical protein cyc_00963 [Cyclospora cayetanensis]|uniref:Uncharacterized protein n=1 Tax=Cyclospora cayetanensis TaxID=88456 RepID=A0A1D3D943_9EIME|nr:hypothetical protein cyc_00963 [Cyclospora cayetanensis]